MEAYKAPDSDLTTNHKRPFKPVKAILYGLSISIILTTIVSVIALVIFGFVSGVDFTNEDTFNLLYTNNLFMFIDVILTVWVLYFSGTVVGKYTPGKEVVFAIIVSVLTLIIFAALFLMTESFSTYPIWYNLSSFVVIPVGIYFGAKSKI